MPRISLAKVEKVEDINWTGLEPIGSGVYGTVFVSPSGRKYAVKVGRITEDDVVARRIAADAGLCPKVYAFFDGVSLDTLPVHIQRAMMDEGTDRNTVQVLIMERVVPALSKHKRMRWDTMNQPRKRLYQALAKLEAIEWTDDHNGNWGYLRGQPVVFDGLNTKKGRW
jgi:hypothetical protein